MSIMSESLAIDEIILTRRKTIALIVQPNGRLIVRAPLRTSQKEIRLLVDRNAGWIRNKQELVKATYTPVAPRQYVTGENFYFLGNPYPLEILNANHPALTFDGKFYLSKTALPNAQAVFERWYRQQALEILTERVQQFCLSPWLSSHPGEALLRPHPLGFLQCARHSQLHLAPGHGAPAGHRLCRRA